MAETPSDSVRALIAYDSSSGAGDAVRAAAQLFAGADAIVLHVRKEPLALEQASVARVALPDAVLVKAAQEHERAAQTRALELVEDGCRLAESLGLRATAELRTGTSAWREIADAAAQRDADVIACGTRDQGLFSRTLLGSTSSSLLHHGDLPLLIVPSDVGDQSGPSLVAYDGSEGARAAIDAAARLLSGRPAVVVHAWSSPLDRSYAREGLTAVPLVDADELAREVDELFAASATELAEEGAAIAREAGMSARAMTVKAESGTWRALATTARSEAAAVIVAGSRGRGALASTMLGSVSAGLAHNAELPVLIAR
jgi:nucleotide-binding universal stress UspA family protein